MFFIKNSIILFIVISLLFTGCSNVPNEQVLNLEITGERYSIAHADNHKYNIPILIKNSSDFKRFIKKYPRKDNKENFFEQDYYSKDYYENHIVYACIIELVSGSDYAIAEKAEINNGELKLFIKTICAPIGTCDMAANVCLFSINKNDIKDEKIKTTKVKNIEQREYDEINE